MLRCRDFALGADRSHTTLAGQPGTVSARRRLRRWEGPLVLGALVIQSGIALGTQIAGSNGAWPAREPGMVELASETDGWIEQIIDWILNPSPTPPPPPPEEEGGGW